jgi:hypothetical protein
MPPLPLAGEGWGEGRRSSNLPALTLALSRERDRGSVSSPTHAFGESVNPDAFSPPFHYHRNHDVLRPDVLTFRHGVRED